MSAFSTMTLPLAAINLFARNGYAPLAWGLAIVLALALALLLRRCGRADRPTGREAGTPFVSGNPCPDPDAARVTASHLYWGFFKALAPYYEKMRAFHSGILTDYVFWFAFSIMALFLAIVIAGAVGVP